MSIMCISERIRKKKATIYDYNKKATIYDYNKAASFSLFIQCMKIKLISLTNCYRLRMRKQKDRKHLKKIKLNYGASIDQIVSCCLTKVPPFSLVKKVDRWNAR